MPTDTFNATADAHVGYVAGTSYPPGPGNGTLTSAPTGSQVLVQRVRQSSTDYRVYNGLLRFDTSLIPDGAIIQAALLNIVAANVNNADSRSLTADYFTWAAADSSAYSATAIGGAIDGFSLSSIATGSVTSFPLSSVSGISKTGSTHLRLHISGGAPSGVDANYVAFAAIEGTNPEAQLVVTYYVPPTANFTSSGSALSRTFTDTSTPPSGATIVGWAWNFGDGGTSTLQNPSHTYAGVGTYSVTLTVTDSNGNTDPETKSISITNQAPTANFSYITSDLTATFTDTSTDPDGSGDIVTRAWNFGDGSTSSATNPAHTYASAGTYTVTLTVTDAAGATDPEVKSVTVSVAVATSAGVARSYLKKHIPLRTASLSAGMDASQLTVPLDDVTYWPSTGVILVGGETGEKMTYNGKSTPHGSGNLTGVTRGQFGTTAGTRSLGAEVALLGRHDGGISTKRKIPTFPVNGSIDLQELRRHEDGKRFAWAQFNNLRETAQLEITGAPSISGNVTTTLDEAGTAVTRSTAVSATAESISLVINNAQTAPGDMTVTLNGIARLVSLGGARKEVVELIINTSAASTHTFTLDYMDAAGTAAFVNISIAAGATVSQIAATIRSNALSGWTISGSGATVRWTRNVVEDVPPVPGAFIASAVGPRAFTSTFGWSISTLEQGAAANTAAQVASQLRIATYSGWQTGGSGTTVTFTYLTPGNLTGTHQYNAGTTGATSTSGMSVTNGSLTDANAVAAAIRATYSGNANWTVSGTGTLVKWVANTTGGKADATFSTGGTGISGFMRILNQGSSDVVGVVQDSSGVQRSRRILANIATSTIFNIETTVSGAGTNKGIVSFWGSFGSNAKVLLWRAEQIDLTQYTLGQIAYGATGESADSLTWEVHTDEVVITDRGETYYRDHSAVGGLIRQFYGFFNFPYEQASSDIYVQSSSIRPGQPVLPGEEVTLGAYLRWDNVGAASEPALPLLPAKPIFITCHHADGTVTEIGDVTGDGITGDGDWQDLSRTFVIPDELPACYEFRFASRDITTGLIVGQELVASVGGAVKRTYRYATSGIVTAVFDIETPKRTSITTSRHLARKRLELEAQYSIAGGTTASTEYRSASSQEALSTWNVTPASVDDLRINEIRSLLDGDGLSTPRLLSGFPRVEYRILINNYPDPVFLKYDRTELDGGVFFNTYQDWFPNTDASVRALVSGRISKQPLHQPVGLVPQMSLLAFRPETVSYIQQNWVTGLFHAEIGTEVLGLSLLSRPEFTRQTLPFNDDDGNKQGYWVSSEVAAEVLSVGDISE